METVQTCTRTWWWCVSMCGARFAVFVRRARVLPSPSQATRNLSFLEVFTGGRHVVVSSCCSLDRTNVHGHLSVVRKHGRALVINYNFKRKFRFLQMHYLQRTIYLYFELYPNSTLKPLLNINATTLQYQ